MGATPPDGAAHGDAAVPDERGDPVDDPGLGPAPQVEGRDEIRARAFARIFGDDATAVADGPGARAQAERDTPSAIGRFRVLDRLGGGGMGVVLAAWDPELERRVAIKLLRPDLLGRSGTVGQARLQREAQAIARINHPNVIAVHEVGSFDDQVFVAMEFVEGATLGTWLGEQSRPWREVLAAFLAAGDGIAAAHHAGVVHRDFKPDNVLVGRDGRVRVVDFGLARASGETLVDPAPSIPEGELPETIQTPLTRTGALMGTPAYMSPEQWLGRAADERSDQFSFAVALFEALYGQRPFVASTVQALAGAVLDGRVSAPADPRGVPRFVELALRRALARDPAARFAHMDDLLAALRRDPARHWRLGLGVLAIAGAASVATMLATDDPSVGDRCAQDGQRIEAQWGAAARERVHAALTATGTPFAEHAWTSVERLLDADAQAWTEQATAACAAAAVATAADDGRRGRCLDDRAAELGAMVELLARADAGIALQAVDAVARLPSPTVCGDPRRLAAYREPSDPGSRTRAASARAELARATASGAVGHYREAIATAQGVVDIATELDDPALEAAALLVRGQNEAAESKWREAERTLRSAVARAELADDHATRAQALTHLVFVVGLDGTRFAEAQALGEGAGSALKIIGADALMRAQLDAALGTSARKAKRFELALEHQRAALDATARLLGDEHPATLRAMSNLATTLGALPDAGDAALAEAETMHRRAVAGLERVLGDEHPVVAVTLSNLAIVVAQRGHTTEAIALLRRSVSIREHNDPNQPSLAQAHFNLGRALYDAREYGQAQAQYALALERRLAAPHQAIEVVDYYSALGNAAVRNGEAKLAAEMFTRRLDIELAADSDPALVAAARINLARALVASDRVRARELLEQARPVIADRVAKDDATATDRQLGRDIQVLAMLVDSLAVLDRLPAG